MKRLMLVAAMLTVLVIAAAPAMAQTFSPFGFDRGFFDRDFGNAGTVEIDDLDAEVGDIAPSVDISNRGNNSALCTAVFSGGNFGGVIQNPQALAQYDVRRFDDVEFGGVSIELGGALSSECNQTINQVAAS